MIAVSEALNAFRLNDDLIAEWADEVVRFIREDDRKNSFFVVVSKRKLAEVSTVDDEGSNVSCNRDSTTSMKVNIHRASS